MIRAVLDTNVVVSGIIKGNGPSGRILASLFQGRFVAVTAAELLDEAARALAYPRIRQKYRIGIKEAEEVVASLALLSDRIELSGVTWRASRDPEDDSFLACAVQGQADVVVTGDKDLLTLGTFQGIRILTAQAFLKLLK